MNDKTEASERIAARQRARVMERWGRKLGLVNPHEVRDQALLRDDSPELELEDLEDCAA